MFQTSLFDSAATSGILAPARLFTIRTHATPSVRRDAGRSRTSLRLWIIQSVLAALFLFAGVMKLIMPVEALAAATHLPGIFMRFIAIAEILGAIGLILPGVLRIRPGLTPLAALGLAIIMIGATTITVLTTTVAQALVPFVVGVLAVRVAYSRRRLLAAPRLQA
ncbi:MAG: DoxX family protein [Gemmatimonadaceae bacterium]